MQSIIFLIVLSLNLCFAVHSGPNVIASKGSVWPQVQKQAFSQEFFSLKPHSFNFKADLTTSKCPNFLNDAFVRYWTVIATSASLDRRNRFPEIRNHQLKKLKVDVNHLGDLKVLNVDVKDCGENDFPSFGDDEKYILTINSDGANLSADTMWGILRGLETFSQLIYLNDDTLLINATSIVDYPRFSHRGLLLDTSRHFLPLYIIYQTLDAMSYNKLNVFHWHITDDASFPYKSLTFPELSDKGAYHPVSKVYEQNDIKKILEYARLRGIRVIPEFDTPGHTISWGLSHPELLTTCANPIDKGPMNPARNSTYNFLLKLFTEIVKVFPDPYFHIGGDEVDFDCWKSNSEIQEFMKNKGIQTYEDLESYFIQNVVTILETLDSKYLVWEEVFVNGVTLPNSTVVHVWKGGVDDKRTVLQAVTGAGKYGIYSSCWYLDQLESGGDWEKFYSCEPLNFNGTDEQKKRVLGGEACMWTESVNEYNVMPRVWPRASAAAEKLWSSIQINDVEEAKPRLEEHTCRMNRRGIAAQPPNGQGVCL